MFSDLRAFQRDPLALFVKRVESEEGLAPLFLGPNPIYLVTDWQIARDILRSEETRIDKGKHMEKLSRVVGLNSVTLSGPEQHKRRTVIHRTLMDGMRSTYVLRFAALVRTWIVDLSRQASFDAHEATSHLALRVISDLLFGTDALSAGDEGVLINALKLIEDDLAVQMFRVWPPLPWTARRESERLVLAKDMLRTVVDRVSNRASKSGFLAALQSIGLAGEALRDEVLMMLVAGHHTTGAAAAWALHIIASKPDLALELAEEANNAMDAAGEFNPLALRSADLSRSVMAETLRLYPSIHWFSRDLASDHNLAGRQLKRGTTLIVSQWAFHRSGKFWSDPDNFVLGRNHNTNPAYIPFGFGPRACTGMSVASLLIQLVALEFALAFNSHTEPAQPPRSSITLVPPQIRIEVSIRTPSTEGLISA